MQLRLLRLQQRGYHERRRGAHRARGVGRGGQGGRDSASLREDRSPRCSCMADRRAYARRARGPLPRAILAAPPPPRNLGHLRSKLVRTGPGESGSRRSSCAKEAWKRAYDENQPVRGDARERRGGGESSCSHLSKKEQLARFHERENKPYKRWKMTKDDWRNRKKWPAYEEAIDDMFRETSTSGRPGSRSPPNANGSPGWRCAVPSPMR